MERDADLQAAVERLYREFAGYPMPRTLDAAPSRDHVAILKSLQSAPLRQLGAKEVSYYAFCAMTTVGGPSNYRYFLPRIVELALDDGSYPGFEPALIANKMGYADGVSSRGWNGWKPEQRVAVRTVFMGAWACALRSSAMVDNAMCWLDGLATLGSVEDALEIWKATPSPYAVEHLASYVLLHKDSLAKIGRIGGGHISAAHPDALNQITAWMRSDETWQRLKDTSSDDPYAQWDVDSARAILRPLDECS